jgi:hypothetical protein
MKGEKILVQFRGDKDCYGVKVGNFVVGGLKDGSAYDVNGMKFGSYKRVVVDGGPQCNSQKVEFTIEVE